MIRTRVHLHTWAVSCCWAELEGSKWNVVGLTTSFIYLSFLGERTRTAFCSSQTTCNSLFMTSYSCSCLTPFSLSWLQNLHRQSPSQLYSQWSSLSNTVPGRIVGDQKLLNEWMNDVSGFTFLSSVKMKALPQRLLEAFLILLWKIIVTTLLSVVLLFCKSLL